MKKLSIVEIINGDGQGVFLRDVERKTQTRSKNNGYNGVIFFDDNNHSYFKVIKFQ